MRTHVQSIRIMGRRLPLPAVVLAVAVVGTGVIGGLALAFTLVPDISLVYSPPSEATRVYAGNGELIASLYRENRDLVHLRDIPTVLQQAVLAIEDDRFYQHGGIDARAVLRATWRNLRARRFLEGGSTITQQLARNVFLTQRRTVSRKVAEMLLAMEIERRLSKQEILERYLNQVYLGQGAYGVEMAAQVYFGKHVGELNLAESAMVAGLIRAPSAYSPFRNFALARQHQRIVLRRMADLGYIMPAVADAVASQRIHLVEEGNAGLTGVRAPHFISYVLPQLLDRYGEELVYNGGLQVYTTLDVPMQIAGERALRDGLDEARDQGLRAWQGALVAIDVRTGFIRAMIGGYAYEKSQFNRAWQARRQPGSAFKPFIYTTAVAHGARPWKTIIDGPVSYGRGAYLWQPKNYDKRFRGEVTMRRALEQSINIPAVKTLAGLGVDAVIRVAHEMGITSPLRPDLSLALGSSEVTPLEMASAYGTLASLGVRAQPIAVTRVLDRSGKVLERNLPQREIALTTEVAYRMTDILKGVILRGTGRGAAIGRPAAGKTGTTDDYRNAWFIGYTPYLSAAVWVGNDDNSPMRKVVGGTVPARIWAAFMRVAVAAMPPHDWERPAGVAADPVQPKPATVPSIVMAAAESRSDDDPGDYDDNARGARVRVTPRDNDAARGDESDKQRRDDRGL